MEVSTMQHAPPLLGKRIAPLDAVGLDADLLRSFRSVGALPVMAGGAVPAGVAQPDPFGITLDGSGRLVVDDYTNPPSVIPRLIRDLVRDNAGYWIESVFNTPGFTVQSGAILYTETLPEDHYLAAGQSIAPRAPGAEAPRIGITRRVPKLAYAESWSGSIEVTDEHRRRNNVIAVQEVFRRAANTFADVLQGRGEEVLGDFLTANPTRIVTAGAGTFGDWAAAAPQENSTSVAPRPTAEFARVARLFAEDKVGVLPNLLITTPQDAEHLDRVYGGNLEAVLRRYNLEIRTSVRRVVGRRLYVRRGQVGTLAWEKPLGDPEYTREGTRFTDVYSLDCAPVFVANGVDSILEVRGTA
jgi:hypothetical protein